LAREKAAKTRKQKMTMAAEAGIFKAREAAKPAATENAATRAAARTAIRKLVAS
jgi:hypothetical protein